MFVLYLILVAFVASQEIHTDSNDISDTKPSISNELEDFVNSDVPNYPWLRYMSKVPRSHDKDNDDYSSEEMSNKQVRRSDSEANAKDFDIADYDGILEEPTMRMGSPLELLTHFLSGKEKVLTGLNEGVLGGKVVLDGLQEITKGLGEFLVTK